MSRTIAASIFLSAAIAAHAETGCVERKAVSIQETICTQFDCMQNSPQGECIAWSCINAQVSSYADRAQSGCAREVNCGRGVSFQAGTPDQPETEINEICDWYPCIQADPTTKVCLVYRCISKRTITITSTAYPNALCVYPRKKAKQKPKTTPTVTPQAKSPRGLAPAKRR